MKKFCTILFAVLICISLYSTVIPVEFPNNSMPLTFTENKGQFGNITKFKCETLGAVFYFAQGEVAYLLIRETDELIEYPEDMIHDDIDELRNLRPRYKKEAILVKAKFLDSNPESEIIGENKQPHYYNYFLGNDHSKWAKRVANYSSVIYKNIYPGIDLKYYGNGKSLKYDFIVHPGADPSVIKIHYEGNESLSVNEKSELIISTVYGDIKEGVPAIIQTNSKDVSGSYYLIDESTFGFRLKGNYDTNRELVIDPELVYSSYYGGSNSDEVWDMTIDNNNDIYLVGFTSSGNFPEVNAYDNTYNGGAYDAFVVKLSSVDNFPIFCTYIGGSEQDNGFGIAFDPSRNIYICGNTQSANFPLAVPYDSTLSDQDCFITKLSSDGDSLIFSTFLGGSWQDHASSIFADSLGCSYITGTTLSDDFPMRNPYQDSHGGTYEVFLTKFSPSGGSLIYSTYLGGSDQEYSTDIVVNSILQPYICGNTKSADFPTVNAIYDNFSGEKDIFIAKFTESGDDVIFSTYWGGSDDEYDPSAVLDSVSNLWMTGVTESPDIPIRNAYDSTHNVWRDAFIIKLPTDGDSLLYSSYFGGNDWDKGTDIAIDKSGNIYLTGESESSDFPLVNPIDSTFTYYNKAYLSVFTPECDLLIFSTFYGGSYAQYGKCLEIDNEGYSIMSGQTLSDDIPIVNAYDSSYNGSTDLYIGKFSPIECLELILTPHSSRVPNDNGYIQFDIELFNCGVTSIPVEAQLQPIFIDCIGTPYTPGFMNKTLTSSLAPSSYFYDSYHIITDNVTGLGGGGVQIYVGYEIDKWLDVDCFEIIFTYPWGRESGPRTFGIKEWGELNQQDNIPLDFSLAQNYPNPFNSSTTIEYTLPEEAHVTLKVYNILGQWIETLVNENQAPGYKTIKWDASYYSSGVYFYKLTTNSQTVAKRMILLK